MHHFTPDLYCLASFLALVSRANASSHYNLTITVPKTTTYYQNPNALCLPASWNDIISFFVANYFAHAATVRNYPGTKSFDKIANLITALLFPAYGLFRAISSITSFSSFAASDLEGTTRAGAFCMVIRSSDWEPATGDFVKTALLVPRNELKKSQNPGASHAISLSQFHVSWANFDYGLISSVQNLAIHGSHNLPKGYDLVSVPRHAQVERHGSISDYAEIKSKYSPVKALIAIVQLLYAIATLYESRVHQIDRFGYAAFGLTVAPYAVMSLLNLIAGLLCPEFEEIYLITSSILEEARSRPDAQFGEVAGDLVECGDGSVQVADTYMGSVVVQVDATFEFDEKAQRHSVSVAAATQSHGSTVGEKDQKFQTLQSTILPTTETAAPHAAKQNDGAGLSEEPYLIFKNRQGTEASGHNPGSILLIPSCTPFKSSLHPLKKMLSYLGVQTENEKPKVPKVDPNKDGSISSYSTTDISAFFIAFIVYGSIIGIIGGISRFSKGDSSIAQRVWTMTWLAIGLGYFIILHYITRLLHRFKTLSWSGLFLFVFQFCYYLSMAPAIGGLVVVGQMLCSYGTCTALS